MEKISIIRLPFLGEAPPERATNELCRPEQIVLSPGTKTGRLSPKLLKEKRNKSMSLTRIKQKLTDDIDAIQRKIDEMEAALFSLQDERADLIDALTKIQSVEDGPE